MKLFDIYVIFKNCTNALLLMNAAHFVGSVGFGRQYENKLKFCFSRVNTNEIMRFLCQRHFEGQFINAMKW